MVNMQFDEAARLREQWGNKPCDHPNIAKEYFKGMHSGDYVCTTCGECFFNKDEWQEARSKALAKKKETP